MLLPFRPPAGDLRRDHDTTPPFRKTLLPELKDLFAQVLLFAQMAGMLELGNFSLDGTKLHADVKWQINWVSRNFREGATEHRLQAAVHRIGLNANLC